MRSDQDSFGHALIENWRGEPTISLIERSDGYLDVDPIQGYFAGFRSWSAHERQAMRRVRGRVLDVGCGAGRHALYLQSKGFDVLGIDESPLVVRVCRERGLRHARVCRVADVSPALGVFDTILMMGNNLGLLGGMQRGKRLLRKLARLTNDEGLVIGQSANPHATRNRFHRRYHRYNRDRGRMPGQIRMRLRHRGYATPWFDYLLMSPAELRRVVAGTGWRVTELIRSDGPMYVAVLEKNR